MRTKTWGRTGIEVPIVGLGTAFVGYVPAEAWQDAGDLRIDEEQARSTLEAGLAAGSTLLDTAPLYGQTRVESVLGEVLRARGGAHGLVLTTKAGRIRDDHDYSAAGISRSVEASLERLGVDRLDAVYVHDSMGFFEEVMGPGGAVEALTGLRDQGMIGAVGVGCADPGETADYVASGAFDVAIVANAWSLVTRRMARRILPAAERHDVGLVIATPLERGLLAVGAGGGATQGGRSHAPDVLALVSRIEELCAVHDVPLLAVSLQWLTRHPQVATAVPGARSAAEAVSNAGAGALDIPEALWAELDVLLDVPVITTQLEGVEA